MRVAANVHSIRPHIRRHCGRMARARIQRTQNTCCSLLFSYAQTERSCNDGCHSNMRWWRLRGTAAAPGVRGSWHKIYVCTYRIVVSRIRGAAGGGAAKEKYALVKYYLCVCITRNESMKIFEGHFSYYEYEFVYIYRAENIPE